MHIFYWVGGKFGEVAEVFLTENTHRMHWPQASDTEPARPVYCQYLALLELSTRHWAPDSGRRIDPVPESGVARLQ